MRWYTIMVFTFVGFCFAAIPDVRGQDEVQVLSIDNYEDGDRPAYSPMVTVTLKVKDFEGTPAVGLVERNSKGDFYRAAYYKYPANPGYGIWRVRLPIKEQEPLRFYIDVKVGETSFVDDNNGTGYLYFPRQGMAFFHDRVMLNKSSLNLRHFTPDGQGHLEAHFAVAVKNLAYAKKVEVVYFLNGDPADRTLRLQYLSRMDYKDTAGETYLAPGEEVELWGGHLAIADHIGEMFYYIRYEVNGKIYVDTNFGRYYSIAVEL